MEGGDRRGEVWRPYRTLCVRRYVGVAGETDVDDLVRLEEGEVLALELMVLRACAEFISAIGDSKEEKYLVAGSGSSCGSGSAEDVARTDWRPPALCRGAAAQFFATRFACNRRPKQTSLTPGAGAVRCLGQKV